MSMEWTQDQSNQERIWLNRMMDVSQIGFWQLDLKTGLFHCSDEVYRMLGFLPEEIQPTSEGLLSLLHDDDRNRIETIIKEQTQSPQPFTVECRLRCKDGHYKWVLSSAKPFEQDQNGKNCVLFGVHRDITESKRQKQQLIDQLKLMLEPEIGESHLTLSDLLDIESAQSLMDKFYEIANIGMAILDLKGNVLVKTGWQDICMKYHRIHPETAQRCLESDRYLSDGVEKGQFRLYKCKNNLWDIATPLYIGNKKLGNLFFGQFFFEDEKIDTESFRQQARCYGFDETDYLQALKRVPRFSRRTIEKAMAYYIDLLNLLTNLSFSRIKMAKLTEESKIREQQFRAIFETANDSIFIKDRNLKYIRVNPAMEKLFSKKAEEILLRSDTELFGQEAGQELIEEDRRVLGGETLDVFSAKPVNGFFHSFHTIKVPLRDKHGEINGLCGIARDITERKQAEDAIRNNRNLLDDIINSLPGALLVIDADFNIIMANKSRITFGMNQIDHIEQVQGKKCYQAFVKRNSPCPWCAVEQVLKTGIPQFETTTPDDPREKYAGKALKVLVTPLKNEDGTIKGAVEYGLEVTELRDAKNKAEAANKAKTQFLANMSHELRTPLNGVIGFSEILKDSGLDDRQKEFVDIVLHSAKNLLSLISDILDFSKIESNRFDLILEKVDIRELIENTLELMSVQAKEKGIGMIKEIDQAIPNVVMLDPLRFKQVLLNLLTNATKFTEKGHVQFCVRTVALNEKEKQVKLHFSIQDTGIGIKPEHQGIIFEAFNQVDMSITRKYGGTGLGLSISKQLLKRMGSTLCLSSVPGKGSHFYFDLELDYCERNPADSKNEPLMLNEKSHVIDSLTGKKILIAEDDEINMKLAKIVLARFSKELILIEAKNGEEAVQLYQKHHPDLILMDVVMPELDGYQATARIRQIDSQIPIVAMTAKALKEDKAICLSMGMNDYITKPISLNQLKETIIRYL